MGRIALSKMPIVQALKNYIENEKAPFSMPGGKLGRGFNEELKEILIKGDITEIEGLDNLHNPQGIIKEAQELLSLYYKSWKSYFLVNGSSSGNLTMIFSALREGDKVLVERQCHKSIFNGIILRKLRPVYAESFYSEENNMSLGCELNTIVKILDEHKDIKAVILTYPNYYGVCCNLKGIIEECRKRRVKVLIDGAHAAHFGASGRLPENPVKLGADMVVMSAHKTLPSLTQGAYLHINDRDLIQEAERYLYMFLTTSPSYPIMASLDYARGFIMEKGERGYDMLLNLIEKYKKLINELGIVKCIDEKDLFNSEFSFDNSRLILHLTAVGTSGYKLLEYLFNKGIQCEMADDRNVVLITSPFNDEKDFQNLYIALKQCTRKDITGKNIKVPGHTIPKLAIPPYEALNSSLEWCSIEKALNKISGDNIVPYPPGIPLIMMGEVIDKEIIDKLNFYIDNEVTVLGVASRKIRVIS